MQGNVKHVLNHYDEFVLHNILRQNLEKTNIQ
jgi:hypothetical protein